LNNHLKTIQQKIAQIKVPEFNEKVKEGFLNYKKAENTLKYTEVKI
jgi:hypothetical protein